MVRSKAIGPRGAIQVILGAVQNALAKVPELDFKDQHPPPPLPTRFFSQVWLGLAGVLHARDIAEIEPHAREAFGFPEGDTALRITNGRFSDREE